MRQRSGQVRHGHEYGVRLWAWDKVFDVMGGVGRIKAKPDPASP